MQSIQHTNEPCASALYCNLTASREKVSASVGEMIKISSKFDTDLIEISPQVCEIFRNSHERYRTTMAVFMYFFLEVS